MKLLLPLAMLMLGILPAEASWHVAETPRVVVRSKMPPAELERLVTDIEQFDALLRSMTGRSPTDTVPQAQIVIFDSIAEAQSKTGIRGFQGGVAVATPLGGIAFVAPNPASDDPMQQTLFHEYAHLFMIAHMGGIQPGWFIEGFAAFFESARPGADGSMSLGTNQKWQHFLQTAGVPPFERIMTLDALRSDGPPPPELYALGWLMTHYYYFSDARRAQIKTYLDLFTNDALGKDGSNPFLGGFAALNADLASHAGAGLASTRAVAVRSGPDARPALRPLRAGEVELMFLALHPVARASAKGSGTYDTVRLDEFFVLLEAAAHRFPEEIGIARIAAQTAVQNGDYDRLARVIDVMIAKAPEHSTLLAAKGIAVTGQAEAGDDSQFAGGIASAQRMIDRALALDPRNVLALYAKYRNLRADGGVTREVMAYLTRANALEPRTPLVQGALIDAHLAFGDHVQARALLVPIAANTHDRESSEYARATLARIAPTRTP